MSIAIAHQIDGFMKIAVRVNIDGQNPFAVDLDRQPRRLRLGARRIQHAATAECDPRGGGTSKKLSARSHSPSLNAR